MRRFVIPRLQPASGRSRPAPAAPLERRPSTTVTRAKRTERFGLVLTPPEREGLRYLAEMEGLAEADVLRRRLRTAINDRPPEHKQALHWPTTFAANGASRSAPELR